MKRSPFRSKKYAESIGTVRWTLAPSNVEKIDSIYFLQKGRFFSKTAGSIELKVDVQMRETILEKWSLKKGGP